MDVSITLPSFYKWSTPLCSEFGHAEFNSQMINIPLAFLLLHGRKIKTLYKLSPYLSWTTDN